jgi:hypothetical protein
MLHVVAISAAGCCRTPSGNIAELGGIPRIKGRDDGVARVEKGLAVCAFSLARVDSGFRREQGDDPSLRNLRDLHTCIAAISLPCLGINPEATVCLDRAVDGCVTDKRVSLELF